MDHHQSQRLSKNMWTPNSRPLPYEYRLAIGNTQNPLYMILRKKYAVSKYVLYDACSNAITQIIMESA